MAEPLDHPCHARVLGYLAHELFRMRRTLHEKLREDGFVPVSTDLNFSEEQFLTHYVPQLFCLKEKADVVQVEAQRQRKASKKRGGQKEDKKAAEVQYWERILTITAVREKEGEAKEKKEQIAAGEEARVLFHQDSCVRVPQFQRYLQYLRTHQLARLWIVSPQAETRKVPLPADCVDKIYVFDHARLLFNINKSRYCVPHQYLTDQEAASEAELFPGIEKKQLPEICANDEMIAGRAIPLHGVVKISQGHSQAGRLNKYRVVVAG